MNARSQFFQNEEHDFSFVLRILVLAMMITFWAPFNFPIRRGCQSDTLIQKYDRLYLDCVAPLLLLQPFRNSFLIRSNSKYRINE
jgi:hypothetical protein